MSSTASEISLQPRRFDRLIGYLREYRGYLILGGVSVVLANGFLLVNPYIVKVIFDKLQAGAASSQILNLALLLIGFSAVAGFFRFMMRRTIIWMSRRLEYDIRAELTRHLFTLSSSFYDTTRTGDLMARATNDLEAVRQMIGPGIMQISNTAITIVMALSMMIYLSPRLTLYAVLPSIIFPVMVYILGNLVHKRFTRIQEHFSLLTATAQENLAGVRVVRAYGQEEAEIKHFANISRTYVNLNLGMARLYGTFFPLIALLAAGLNLIVLYYGGLDVLHGTLPLGTMVAFFAYLTILYWPMMAIGWVMSLYQRGTASLDRINSILNTPPVIKDEIDNPHRGKMRGEVELRNIRFAYDGKRILDGITLRVEAGTTVGIVGLTGSGKTTLVTLLARTYPVERGMVFVDDVDINDWSVARLRQQIGFVTQEPFLFSDSMTENIRFGRSEASMETVRQVAEMAALAKDVESFPAGYNTMVGERGITLSGGQKQRTAIARALAIDPAILVLDDATSAVDTETDHEINEAIKRRANRCTTFIISHRMSSVKDADLIIFLENGKIAEQGTHEQLMTIDGNYAELYRSQLLAAELEQL
jgi:ATP-binding cassette subfamily B protein